LTLPPSTPPLRVPPHETKTPPPWGDGRPLDPDELTRAFRMARTTAGIEGVRLHDLHAFASLLIRSGTDPKLVSELMGHSDVSFTLRVYVHPNDDEKAAAAEKVGAAYADAFS